MPLNTFYREQILVEATPDPKALGGWAVRYGYQSKTPNAARKKAGTYALTDGGIGFDIQVVQPKRPGIEATLRIEARTWQ